jgi:hypothetical protein
MDGAAGSRMVEGSMTVAQGISHDPAIQRDEASRLLRELQTDIRDQDDLERDIERQVSNQGAAVE